MNGYLSLPNILPKVVIFCCDCLCSRMHLWHNCKFQSTGIILKSVTMNLWRFKFDGYTITDSFFDDIHDRNDLPQSCKKRYIFRFCGAESLFVVVITMVTNRLLPLEVEVYLQQQVQNIQYANKKQLSRKYRAPTSQRTATCCTKYKKKNRSPSQQWWITRI